MRERKREIAGFGWWIKRVDRPGEKRRGQILHKSGEKRRAWRGRRATPLAGDQTPCRTVHGVTDEERLSNAPPAFPTTREKHRLSKRAPAALVSPDFAFLAGPLSKFEGNQPARPARTRSRKRMDPTDRQWIREIRVRSSRYESFAD